MDRLCIGAVTLRGAPGGGKPVTLTLAPPFHYLPHCGISPYASESGGRALARTLRQVIEPDVPAGL